MIWLALGALNALVSVAAGAFGAHGLKARLSPELLAIWETGARYHTYHALGLCVVGLCAHAGLPRTSIAGTAMLVGIALFSGSLYALALSGVRTLGAVTPLGGLAFMVGWAALAWSAWSHRAP